MDQKLNNQAGGTKDPVSGGNDRNNANHSSRRGRNDNNKGQNGGGGNNSVKKFAGLDKDKLEGIVINDAINTPVSQQFDTFCEALVIHGGSRDPWVKTALQTLKDINKSKLAPDQPDESLYKKAGTEDKELKEALFSVWSDEMAAHDKRHSKHQVELEKTFATVWGQLSRGIKDNLQTDAKWEAVDRDDDTLALIIMLRDLCCRDNNTKISAPMDLIHKLRKFLNFKQENNKPAASCVDEAKTKFEVFKSAGGSVISEELIKHTPQKDDKCVGKDHQDCLKMTAADKSKVHSSANQILVSFVIIDGSNDEAHRNLSQTLADQCTLGVDHCPATVSDAQELLNQCKAKAPPKINNNNRSGRNQQGEDGDKKEGKEENAPSGAATMMVTSAEGTKTKEPPGQDKVEKAHQLLLNACGDDDFGNEDEDRFMFMHASDIRSRSDEAEHSDENTEHQDEWSLAHQVEGYEWEDICLDDFGEVKIPNLQSDATEGHVQSVDDMSNPPSIRICTDIPWENESLDECSANESSCCESDEETVETILSNESIGEDTYDGRDIHQEHDAHSAESISDDSTDVVNTDTDPTGETANGENTSQVTTSTDTVLRERLRRNTRAEIEHAMHYEILRLNELHVLTSEDGETAGVCNSLRNTNHLDQLHKQWDEWCKRVHREMTHPPCTNHNGRRNANELMNHIHHATPALAVLPRLTPRVSSMNNGLPAGGSTDMNNVFVFAQQNNGKINPHWILLDSQATCNVVCDGKLVSHVREHPNGNAITIHCNAGSVAASTIADLPGFGVVWHHPDGIANCLSSSLVSDMHRITLDASISQAFFVHEEDGSTRRFDRTACGLCACDIRQTDGVILSIATAEGQKKSHSDMDIRRAKGARKPQEALGFPGDKDFLNMTDHDKIMNCGVTRRDVIMAKDVFGVNTNIVEGKTARTQPEHVREDITKAAPEILKAHGRVSLSVDMCHINNLKFFRSASRHMRFRTSRCIKDSKASTSFACLKAIVGLCEARGFTVVEVHGDNEFNCIADEASSESSVAFHPVARNSHEPFIERDNRTSEERLRCVFASSPFTRLPPRMTIKMVVAVDFWLNCWCSRNGASTNVPPGELIAGIKSDARKHCRFQCGDCVLAHNESDNTMKPRATDAIHLRPTGSASGGFCVFDLTTARRVHRRSATLAHVTSTAIEKVHAIARQQDAPVGLVFGDFQNNSTILDLEEGNPTPEEEDDDDASDPDYEQSDNHTAETVLTDVDSNADETTVDQDLIQGGRFENDPQEPHDDPGMPGDEDDAIEDTGDREETTDQSFEIEFADDESNQDGHHVDIDHPSDDDDRRSHASHEDRSDDGHNSNEEDDPANDDDPQDSDMIQPTRLRPTVIRTHNRYAEADGFERSVHHRCLFTAGFGGAVHELERESQALMSAAQAVDQHDSLEASQVTPQHGVNKGIKIFGEAGVKAVLKELKQSHDPSVMSPCKPDSLTAEERKRALPHLMFPKRKRCGKIKGRGCADGRPQREFINREDASSPTVNPHALMLSCVTDATEERDVATADAPGAFLQTDMPKDEIVHIRLDGAMALLLAELDPELHNPCLIKRIRRLKKGETRDQSILHAKASKAMCGTLRAALLFWENLSGKLKQWGFVQNPCDRCTANKMINGEQCTTLWHVDDLKVSHRDPKVVTGTLKQLDAEYGRISPLTVTRGLAHECLGMTIDFSTKHRVEFTMMDCSKDVLANLPDHLQERRKAPTPAGDHPFNVDPNAQRLNKAQSEEFHHCAAKLPFAAKRARPDLQTAVAFLCTRVQHPDADDQKKLIRVLGCLRETTFLPLILGTDGTNNVCWHADASFAAHNDMKSHAGGLMTPGVGAAVSMSTKQKINTKSSTEAEIVGVDDALPFDIWCCCFLREQGCHAAGHTSSSEAPDNNLKHLGHNNILYQDNTSAIRLETNGKLSSTKRTRHINVRFFLIVDKLKRREVSSMVHCPTADLISDYYTEPLQGSLFRKFRNAILGISDADFIRLKVSFEDAQRAKSNAE